MNQQMSDLDQAVDLLKSGNKTEAKRLAQLIIEKDPKNERAWALYSATCIDLKEKTSVLEEYLKINPESHNAQNALIRLLKKQLETTVNPVTEKASIIEENREKNSNTFSRILIGVIAFSLILVIFFMGRKLVYTNKDYEFLESKYSQLLVRYDQKQSDLNSLVDDYQMLKDQNEDLKEEYESLESDLNQVLDLYNDLKQRAILPPYILTKNREVDIAFNRLDKSVETWNVPFDTLEIELLKGFITRTYTENPNNFQALQFENGEIQYVEDMTLFIDAPAFENVIPGLYIQSESESFFIQEIWNIVTQLAIYSPEIGETPRFPLETFLEGGGDCEDTAILFASMILAAPVDWTVELVYMDIYNPTNPNEVNHVIVHIDTGTDQYFIETTSDSEMQPYKDGVSGWYYEVFN